MKHNLTILLLLSLFIGTSQNTDDYNKWSQNFQNGSSYYSLESFSQAEDEFEKAYNLAKKLFETNSEEFINTAYSYAIVLVQAEKNNDAREPMEKAIIGIKSLYGEKSEPYGTALTILANIYVSIKSYKLAKDIYLESNEIIKTAYGENHYLYGIALTNLAGFYREIEDYKNALNKLNKGLVILKDNPDFDQQYYNNLRYNNLPGIYQGLGRLEDALIIEKESLNFIKLNYGKNTSNYANILTSIGGLHINLGNFNKAEKVLEEAASIFEYLDNYEDEEALGNVYLFLVACYSQTSDFKKAFLYASEGIRLTKLESSNPPSNALNYYEILGSLAWNLGTYDIARDYILKVIDGTIASIGQNAPQLPVLKSQLGICYMYLNESDKAEQLIIEAFETVKKSNYSIKDKEYRECLDNLSTILIDQKKYREAIKNLSTTLKREDKSHPAYWLKLSDLANVYLLNNQCNKALKLFEEALSGIKQFYGKNDSNYINALNKYISAKACQKKYGAILNDINEADQLTKNQIQNRFSFSNEGLKRIFLTQLEHSFDIYESVNVDYQNTELTILNLENQYLLKGLLLNQSKIITSKLKELNDEAINSKVDTYINNKQLLNRLEDKKEFPNDKDLDELKSDISAAEIELVQLYNDSFKKPIKFNKSWKKVQNKLKGNEVAIEFSRFNYINNAESDSIYYLAYIVMKNYNNPIVIQLFEEKQLGKILKSSKYPNQLYLSRGSKASIVGNKIDSKALYNLIWKPIEQYLKGINTIYFSPAGLLHNISFASIKSEGHFLIRGYNLNQLSSTYEIVDDFEQPSFDNILIMGGIEYDYQESLSDQKENYKYPKDFIGLETKRSEENKWNYLPGTLKEINNLNELLSNYNKTITILKGYDAKESIFKQLGASSPNILHIATHGFFYENEHKDIINISGKNSKFKVADNPLKRSGILLSGANYAWLNGNNPNEIDNGILTAEEISNLDLSNTDMVVLSACETGLGDIDGSEGVYGLQRAFKMAGVDIIVMSLWEVPDKETAEFMYSFYSNWLEGMKVREAFITTQRTLSNKYVDNPEKWAAFVLFE
ncbi:CHAT domain-containing protein [Winogradskyella sp. PG-2]|uniref:CHAT domain-containing protein n=1 Tax=Winogradskyella sp. PG-2 TaxID=754409 RepID=UPI00045877A0|nr:CHAT domain-containing protein [Winogradskyella sp. PG-2]BAO74633.1 hypothetical protein WPG_0403 [Winogradskyella sp. PG-2]